MHTVLIAFQGGCLAGKHLNDSANKAVLRQPLCRAPLRLATRETPLYGGEFRHCRLLVWYWFLLMSAIKSRKKLHPHLPALAARKTADASRDMLAARAVPEAR